MSGHTRALLAEAAGTFWFIFIGAGAIIADANGSGGGLLTIALAHGIALAVAVSAFGALSGGHFNPAVTFALAIVGLLLAGVAGNLTDRMFREPGPFRGHVIDFLMLPNWPVFNVADMCINVAAGLILIQAFRGIRIDGTRTHDRDQAAGEPEA